MNLLTVFSKFPDQESCIEHLEAVRYRNGAYCPHCGSMDVARKSDGDRVGRWNCHDCKSSFNVLSDTVMEKTRIPLQKWFLGISLMINAKKSLSSYQLGRDLALNQKAALYMQHRIRAAMVEDKTLLHGIVEADETYVGGKPRKSNERKDDEPSPRGRGTKKTPVIGAVERGGKVTAQVGHDLTGKGILHFIRKSVDPEGSVLITDEYKAYNAINRYMPHTVVNHQKRYADGMTHTNTIEGFWALVKRAWYGSHHKYAVKYMPLFIAEATWKYNQRENADAFSTFIKGVFA